MNYERMRKSELIGILRMHDARRLWSQYGGQGSPHRAIPSALSDDTRIDLLDDFPVPVWRAGTDGGCSYVNRALLSFTGRPLESVLGNGWLANVHPDDVVQCVSGYLDAFSARLPFELEYRLRRHDGEYRWFIGTGHPMNGTEGDFSGYIGLLVDITERKIAESTLNALISASPVGQAILDKDFRYVRVNAALAQMNDLSVEAHYGRSVREVVPNLFPDLEELFQGILKTGESSPDLEISGETAMKPGVVRHWLASHFPIPGSDGRPAYIGATIVEITERRKAEEALLIYQEQLKGLVEEMFLAEERERRRIAGELHDQIGQALALAKIRLVTLEDELEGRAAARTLNRVVELIDNSIREIRTLTFKISPPLLFDVGLEAAVEWLGDKFFEDHGLMVSVSKGDESLPLCEEQRVTLFQVVRELLVNVVKHAEARRVVVAFESDEESVRIKVEDDGRGFDPDSPLAGNRQGGFGLFNVRQKVEYAGGELHLHSVSGAGTKIIVRLPLGS